VNRRRSRVDAWYIESLGWPALVLVLVAAAGSIWFARVPVPGLSTDDAILFGLAMVALFWWIVWRMTPREDRVRARSSDWAVPCTLLAIGVWLTLYVSPLPMRAAFRLSLPALERAVSDFEQTASRSSPRPHRVGLFRVSRIEPVDDGVGLRVNTSGRNWVGFARMTTPPGRWFEGRATSLGGNWYFVLKPLD